MILFDLTNEPSSAGGAGLGLWDFADPKLIAGFAVAVPRYLLSTALKVGWWLLAVGFIPEILENLIPSYPEKLASSSQSSFLQPWNSSRFQSLLSPNNAFWPQAPTWCPPCGPCQAPTLILVVVGLYIFSSLVAYLGFLGDLIFLAVAPGIAYIRDSRGKA